MRPDGSYVQARPGPDEPVRDTHERLMRLASDRVPDDRSGGDSEPRREPSVDLDSVFTPDTDAS
jgi:polyphosphate kinase